MALINCPECGKEISDKAPTCPNCGFPLAGSSSAVDAVSAEDVASPVSAPTSDVDQNKSSDTATMQDRMDHLEKAAKGKNGIIIAVIAIAVLVIAAILISNAIKDSRAQKAAEEAAAAEAAARLEYIDNLKTLRSDMLSTGADAENVAGLIHDVWYNTIFKEVDPATNKYTIKSKSFITDTGRYSDSDFNDDFNTSLSALMFDPDIISKLASIETECDEISELYGKMQNPPADLTACYTTLSELYDAFLDLTGCATNPTGNLTSYTQTFNQADSDFMDAYKKLGSMIPEDEPSSELDSAA